MPTVLKYGILSLLEATGSVQACTEIVVHLQERAGTDVCHAVFQRSRTVCVCVFNLLAPEFGIQILAHPVFKM